MMEVKHNAPMEFSDLTSTSNGNGSISTPDAVDHDELVQNLKSSLLKDDLLQSNEPLTNGVLSGINGSDVVDLDSVELDMDVINPELEEKLLADDDADVVDKLLADVIPSTVLESNNLPTHKKATTTTVIDPIDSSDVVRDPGDDLDTLLSKINDIVDDCSELSKSPPAKKGEEDIVISCDTPDKSTEDTETLNDTDQDRSDNSVIVLDDSILDAHDDSEPKNTATTNEISSAKVNENFSAAPKDSKSEETSGNIEEKKKKAKESSPDKETTIDLLDEDRNELSGSDQIILDVDCEATRSDTKNEEKSQKTELRSRSQSRDNSTVPESKSSEQTKTAENKELEEKTDKTNTPEVDDSMKPKLKGSELSEIAKEDADATPPVVSHDQVNSEPEIKESELGEVAKKDTEVKSAPVSLEADDSDDDVVFFYDCINGAEEKDSTSCNENPEKPQQENEEQTTVKEPLKEADDDDVVLLDDEEEDEKIVAADGKGDEVKADEDKTSENAVAESSEASAIGKDTTANEFEETPEQSNVEHKEEQTTATVSKECENSTSQENCASEVDKDPELDHSDNAQDKFDDQKSEKPQVEAPTAAKVAASAEIDETNSNCSSSSNLLQEAKESASVEGEDETDQGNDDEYEAIENECEGATEVDIIETEVVDEESKEASEDKSTPPAKRIRLSVDDDEVIKKEPNKNIVDEKPDTGDRKNINKTDVVKKEGDETKETPMKSEGEKPSLKRSLENSPDEDSIEFAIKKTKSEEEQTEAKPEKTDMKSVDEKENEKEGTKSNETDVKESKVEEKLTQVSVAAEKAVDNVPIVKPTPSDIPVPLYPPPDFQTTTPDLNLDFLKRFKKSMDKITKSDLEELVLQKIVEAIIHKSEFGEMRELIEKQEKIIATLRTKISDLSKQFRDLEMVHSRVLKDIETKNSQFLMPVKITRAVGLQVQIPYKKNSDPVSNAAANSLSPPGVAQNPNASQSVVNHPYRTANPASQLTSPARPTTSDFGSSSAVSSSMNTRLSNTVLASAVAAAAANTRRGCVQKITPQRPMEPMSSVTSSSSPASSSLGPAYRGAQQQAAQSTQQSAAKLLTKSVATGPGQVRGRYSGPASMTSQQQLALSRQQQPSPTNQFRKIAPAAAMSKQSSSNPQQYRRSESLQPTSLTPASMPDNYMNPMHQMSSGMPAVSIVPTKPKEKSVIDLTDEDDAPSSASSTSAAPRQRVTNVSSAGSGGSSGYLLNKMSNPQSRLSGSANQTGSKVHLAGRLLYGSKANGSPPVPTNISSPNHGGVTRVASQQRSKYGHPAPLPPTPTQNLNPAWKLPPPRPTIRISNLDNGIVISWTVEESMDRHAECVSYQIYAYQETSGPPLIDSWRHVGDVKAMLLPMAVTLTQFQEGQRYYFAVRAVDVHHRVGPFSLPKTWS